MENKASMYYILPTGSNDNSAIVGYLAMSRGGKNIDPGYLIYKKESIYGGYYVAETELEIFEGFAETLNVRLFKTDKNGAAAEYSFPRKKKRKNVKKNLKKANQL